MSQGGPDNVDSAPGVVDYLQGNTGGPVGPNAGNIVFLIGGGSISVSGNALDNTLTIADTGLNNWQRISTSQALVSNTGYFCVGGGALSLSLPATSNLGDQITISLQGSTSFTVTQGASQQINVGNTQTTTGVGGSLVTTQQGDTITLTCLTINLVWVVTNMMGNPTII